MMWSRSWWRSLGWGGFVLVVILVLGPVSGCSDDSTSVPQQGSEGGACYDDGTCDLGLDCSDGQVCEVPEPCRNQDCSGHGTCVVLDGDPACDCDQGYHAHLLTCLEGDSNPCEAVDCSNHGDCVVTDGEASCECFAGYHAEGMACIADEVDPCDGVDCAGHGTCLVQDGQVGCDCEDGYQAREGTCIANDQIIGPLATVPTPIADGTLFVAPDGEGTDCSEAQPCDIWTAAGRVEPGDVVFLLGGVYDITQSLAFDRDGTEELPIVFESYPGEHAVLDGSSNALGDEVWIRVLARYNQIRRIEIRNMPRQGLYVRGCHNLIEGVESHHNGLTGIQIVSPYDAYPYGEFGSYNVVRNCTAHDNFDEGTEIPGFNDGDNADGFSISSGDGNLIEHCLAYHNSDDGFDCWRSTNTTFLFSKALSNGYGSNGNGNGFKAGGLDPSQGAVVAHCIAQGNLKRGFTYNSGLDVTFSYNTSNQNGDVEFVSGETTSLDHNIAVATQDGRTHTSQGLFDDNSWDREGEVTFISEDPDSPDFLRPVPGGGFEDIGAYAQPSP